MSLLKYIHKPGLGALKSTSGSLAKHDENTVIQTQYVLQSENDVNTIGASGGDVECSETLSKKRKNENETISKRSAKRLGKNIVISESGDSSNEEDRESDLVVLDRVECLIGSVPDLVNRFKKKGRKEARLRDRISRYRVRMSVQNEKIVKMVKKVRQLKNPKTSVVAKGREAIRILGKNKVEHAKVVEELKKQLYEAEEKLKQVHEEIEQEKEKVNKLKQVNEIESRKLEVAEEERKRLETELERVSSERKWLIEEGFEYVINRLLRSREYNERLGAAQSLLWSSGAHYGFVAGYAQCKEGSALEDHYLFEPEAHGNFVKAVHELEHPRFPYLEALSRCVDRTLDELKALKPIGLEEVEDEVAGE